MVSKIKIKIEKWYNEHSVFTTGVYIYMVGLFCLYTTYFKLCRMFRLPCVSIYSSNTVAHRFKKKKIAVFCFRIIILVECVN